MRAKPNTAMPAMPETDWGFSGMLANHAPAAWPLAVKAIAHATGRSPAATAAFLATPRGGSFAGAVSEALAEGLGIQAAINLTVRTWSTWTVTPDLTRDTAAMGGMSYLKAMVILDGEAS